MDYLGKVEQNQEIKGFRGLETGQEKAAADMARKMTGGVILVMLGVPEEIAEEVAAAGVVAVQAVAENHLDFSKG